MTLPSSRRRLGVTKDRGIANARRREHRTSLSGRGARPTLGGGERALPLWSQARALSELAGHHRRTAIQGLAVARLAVGRESTVPPPRRRPS